MRKTVLAVVLSCLVSSLLVAAPPRAPRHPSPKGISPMARFVAAIGSFLKGFRLAGDVRNLPPPPSTLISGG